MVATKQRCPYIRYRYICINKFYLYFIISFNNSIQLSKLRSKKCRTNITGT